MNDDTQTDYTAIDCIELTNNLSDISEAVQASDMAEEHRDEIAEALQNIRHQMTSIDQPITIRDGRETFEIVTQK